MTETVNRARVVLILAAALAARPAAAGEGDRLRLAPYFWIPSVTGTIGSGGGDPAIPSRIDVDFTKFEENLRLGGAMLNLAWRHGPWVAYGDWTYANVRTSAPTTRGVLYTDAEAQLIGNVVQAFGGYGVLDVDGFRLDLGAGVRAYSLYVRLELGGAALAGRETSGDALWADVLAAVRGIARLGERWEAIVQADVGAGGSNLSWQVIAAAGYHFSWGGLFAGWRHLAVNYEKDTLKLDIALSGPIIGAIFEL